MDTTEIIDRLVGTDEAPSEEALSAELAELDDEALGTAEQSILEHYRSVRAGEVEGTDAADLAALSRIRDARQVVCAEAARRYEAAAEAAQAAAEAESQAAALDAEMLGNGDEPAEGDDDKDKDDGDDAADKGAGDGSDDDSGSDGEQATAAVVPLSDAPGISRPSLAQLVDAPRPAEAKPAALAAHTRPRWEAISPREPISDWSEAAERLIAASEELVATAPGVTFKRPVVRVAVDYPEHLLMREGDPRGNTRKMLALTDGMTDPERWDRPELEAIVASGGWCAPLEPRYDVMTVAQAHRPFRDGLPSSGAERGGVRVIRGLGIEGITTGGPSTANAAVGIWDADTDESPGVNTKGRQSISCPTPVDVELQAIYHHRKVGNFQGRAWPELIEAETRRTMAAHARVAETELLDCVCDNSLTITEAAVLGSSRDLLVAFRQAKAQMVNRQRMSGALIEDVRVRLWLPHWAPAMMAADINRQQASGELDALSVTESQIVAWIRAQGINVGFYADSMTGGSGIWGDIADNTTLRNWPTTVQWMMYPEGSFLFLDGGTLDLGVYRDGTLIGTNDYAIFAETFEACAFVGITDAALCVTHTVCPNGESQVATDETGSVCSAS